MGSDFSNHKIFLGNLINKNNIDKPIEVIKSFMLDKGLQLITNEKEANRSFVLYIDGSWLHLGDTAGSTGYKDKQEFGEISKEISKLLPVIDIKMNDGVALNLELYIDGLKKDTYANVGFPFYRFDDEEEGKPFKGNPDLWKNFLLRPEEYSKLNEIWIQEFVDDDIENEKVLNPDDILSKTASLFGWSYPLYEVGYTYDLDGVSIKYNDFLKVRNFKKSIEFIEIHFKYIDKNVQSSKTIGDIIWND